MRETLATRKGVRDRSRRLSAESVAVEGDEVKRALAVISTAASAAADSSGSAGRSRQSCVVSVGLRSEFARKLGERSTSGVAGGTPCARLPKTGASYIGSGGGAGATGTAGGGDSHLPPLPFLAFLNLRGLPISSILSRHAGTACAACSARQMEHRCKNPRGQVVSLHLPAL